MKCFRRFLCSFCVVILIIALNSCSNDDNTNPPATTDTGTITGYVMAAGDAPLADVAVTTGNLSGSTSADGKFTIQNVPVNAGVIVQFKKAGMSSALKIVKVLKGKTSEVNAYLSPTGGTADITGTGGGSLETNGAKVEIPAGAIIDANGNSVSGNVKLEATYFRTDMNNFARYFPGNFRGTRTDGSETDFKSYGFIDVQLSSGGQNLNIGNGKKATIEMQISPDQLASAPNEIPLWYLDEKTGKWKEEGKAIKSGDKYMGQVGHFTKWNCDMPIPANMKAYVTGKVSYLNGTLPWYIGDAWIFGADSTEFAEYVDSTGRFIVEVFANKEYVALIKVLMYYFSIPVNFVSPQAGDTIDIGEQQVELDSNQYCHIYGRMVNSNGTPLNEPIFLCPEKVTDIQNIFARTSYTEGKFDFMVLPNIKYKYWIISLTTGKIYGPVIVTAPGAGQKKDLGDIELN